ncbi:hypothetical protein GBAR_LOCUS10036 [Geodia barretti]|uniref:Uncharacterized protein n=1 Tax=Geodia barretti TaxID=519541 RepID=A0AA35WGF1_GEOBA|nr:hypothetical protein GBAR_LOCUS10036 [Geodia barretti]
MAQGKLSEEGLHHIRYTLRRHLPDMSDMEFKNFYWKPSLCAMQRACGRAKKKGNGSQQRSGQ